MTAEVEQDENATTIAKELLELGLIHEVIFLLHRNSESFIHIDYIFLE
jgi:hypothetical protein